jgi:multicomponent Na+:H+ antiporter subunit E
MAQARIARGRIAHAMALAAALALLWWVLSGHTETLIVALGALSILIALAVAWRLRLLDREGVPFAALHRRIPYMVWLGGEIAKANIEVVKLALRPELDITPRLVRVPAVQTSGLGLSSFANSITLTPGTVSIDVGDSDILVHALDGSLANAEITAGMGARVAAAFDPRPTQPAAA